MKQKFFVARRFWWLWLLVALLLGLSGWLLWRQGEAARAITFVIPAGAAQQLEAGQPAFELPAELVLTIGVKDTLVIENQDEATHTFGPFVLPPHTTMTKRFYTPLVYEGACTLHRSQQMKLVVQAPP